MHDHRSHSLLQQLPLSVSPFIHLPTAVTLPYSYQTLPLSLPPSSTAPQQPPSSTSAAPSSTPGYIVSPSGAFTTTPAAVINLCQTLITHLQTQQKNAEETIREWEKGIEERELMEKRRVAPGYLDTGLRILEPTRREAPATSGSGVENRDDGGGEELDRVFGKMGI